MLYKKQQRNVLRCFILGIYIVTAIICDYYCIWATLLGSSINGRLQVTRFSVPTTSVTTREFHVHEHEGHMWIFSVIHEGFVQEDPEI